MNERERERERVASLLCSTIGGAARRSRGTAARKSIFRPTSVRCGTDIDRGRARVRLYVRVRESSYATIFFFEFQHIVGRMNSAEISSLLHRDRFEANSDEQSE